MYNSDLSIYEVSVGGITTIVEMSLFSTLLVKLCLHTKKRRCESGKQPTLGSQIESFLFFPQSKVLQFSRTNKRKSWKQIIQYQCQQKIYREWREWCEWKISKPSPVPAKRIKVANGTNGEEHFKVEFFCQKQFSQEARQIAAMPVLEPTSHISEPQSTSQNHRANLKEELPDREEPKWKNKLHIQGGTHQDQIRREALSLFETSHKGRMLEFEFFVTRCFQIIASLRRITTTEPIICILYFYLLIFIANESARICCTNV